MEARMLSFSDISPFIRYAEEFLFLKDMHPDIVRSSDCRLFFITGGKGEALIEKDSHPLRAGNLLILPPGTPYRFRPIGKEGLKLIAVNFDYTFDHQQLKTFLPLISEADYQEACCLEKIHFTDAPEFNHWLFLESFPEGLPYIQSIVEESASPDRFSSLQESFLLRTVLNLLRRNAARLNIKSEHGSFREIIEYIREHMNEDLSNESLAAVFHYHPNYVSSLLKLHTGMPLHRYLLNLRVRQALYLLQTTDTSVSEIALQVGFNSSSYFSHYFKKCTGYSPGAFRI